MTRILVVDDDLALADVLAFALRRAGYDVLLAHEGWSGIDLFMKHSPDLVILDWMLPDIDGLEVCKRLRSKSSVPIIMLTVRQADDDVVSALETGADEYITKPFSPRQLIARVRAVLRRAAGETEDIIMNRNFELNEIRQEVSWEGQRPIHLTYLETMLLRALMRNPGQTLTTESLITRIWGPGKASPEMLKQLIYRLRKKIEGTPGSPILIETIRNRGFELRSSYKE
jgi:DNA-binding response OmpR family regulator